MNTSQMTETYFETVISPCLRSFMCDNITDLNDCVDWVCNVFDINATDELIDQIADEFDAFFGNWFSLTVLPLFDTEMTQDTYTEALNFLINYFNQFDEEELQSYGKLYVNDIVNILGYATFEDNLNPEIGYISNVTTLNRLRNEIADRFYN